MRVCVCVTDREKCGKERVGIRVCHSLESENKIEDVYIYSKRTRHALIKRKGENETNLMW